MSIRLYILMAFGGLVALVLLIVGIGFLVGYLVGFMVDKCSKDKYRPLANGVSIEEV
ncbi:hypothetical protein DPMN_162618 [Dreissena polymorpha]|uniref:Uncharacterized protein n=1 Tax=Dreissena polymorpha TaxID=45954 RepID=A0A9D4IS59_DREPO|nr:hypothetical protein DPMN_162618 [Dreissena polymorpha]